MSQSSMSSLIFSTSTSLAVTSSSIDSISTVVIPTALSKSFYKIH